MKRVVPLLALCFLLAAAPVAPAADTLEANGLRLVKVGDFDQPVFVTSPPGDQRRIFVVQKGYAGQAEVRVVRDGVKLAKPFLAVKDVATVREQGMLSMAFSPDYATSGRFYVYFTDLSACGADGCDVRIDEYRRADSDHAAPASRRKVLSISHRDSGMHNGGTIMFGPDGMLYAAPGDGGTPGDPECDAQRPDSLLGKILRFDPRGATGPEVVARGLRNPYRFAFDRATGDLLLGDVGYASQEEIDFVPAGRLVGSNFGWNAFEGRSPFSGACASSPLTGYVPPVITYGHPAYTSSAVTGGVVVRDLSVAPLLGRYVYADFYAGEIRSAAVGATGATGDGPTGLQVEQVSSFGQDASCRVYVTSLAAAVYRLEAARPATAPSCQTGAGAPAAALPPDRIRPVLSRLSLSRVRFRVGDGATPGVARAAKTGFARRSAAGTVFRYRLSETAAVSVRFQRAARGRRWISKGRLLRRRIRAGRQVIRFSGRVGTRALRPGRYRATLRARDGAGNLSVPRSVRFTIVAG